MYHHEVSYTEGLIKQVNVFRFKYFIFQQHVFEQE